MIKINNNQSSSFLSSPNSDTLKNQNPTFLLRVYDACVMKRAQGQKSKGLKQDIIRLNGAEGNGA